MLNEAQNINVVALYPWLLYPVVPVIVIILAFNFLGDGLRDAADPIADVSHAPPRSPCVSRSTPRSIRSATAASPATAA